MYCGKAFKPKKANQVYCKSSCGDAYRNSKKREEHRADFKNNVVDHSRKCTVAGCKRFVKKGNRFLCAEHFRNHEEIGFLT